MNSIETTITPPSLKQRCRVPVCWALLIAFDVSLMALTYAQDGDTHSDVRESQSIESTIAGPNDARADAIRFEAIDVFVDSGKQSLAAWQLELICRSNGVEIVGIEGGEHPAFKEPPYYDPRAMNNNRVILGAFNTGAAENLPTGRSRVARVHVQITGPGDRSWHTELTTSATFDGTRIPAKISIAKSHG